MPWIPLHTRSCSMAQSRHRCAHLLSKRKSSGTDTSHDTQVKTSPKMTEQGTPKLTLQKRQQTSTKNCQNQLLHNNWTRECHQELTSKGTLHEEATALQRAPWWCKLPAYRPHTPAEGNPHSSHKLLVPQRALFSETCVYASDPCARKVKWSNCGRRLRLSPKNSNTELSLWPSIPLRGTCPESVQTDFAHTCSLQHYSR